MTNEQTGLKLSQQAIGTLLMTLQKCLAEETDITELLADWNLRVENEEIFVSNPPTFSFNTETPKFEVE
tara:strand:- start:370 stop:576 length:207 start_codon:yes stop_codon:yes gene_type:complete